MAWLCRGMMMGQKKVKVLLHIIFAICLQNIALIKIIDGNMVISKCNTTESKINSEYHTRAIKSHSFYSKKCFVTPCTVVRFTELLLFLLDESERKFAKPTKINHF